MPYKFVNGTWKISFNYYTYQFTNLYERSTDLLKLFGRYDHSNWKALQIWHKILYDYSTYMVNFRLVDDYFENKNYYGYLSEQSKFYIAQDEAYLKDFIIRKVESIPIKGRELNEDDKFDYSYFEECYEVVKDIVNYIDHNNLNRKYYDLINYLKPIKVPKNKGDKRYNIYISDFALQEHAEAVKREQWIKNNQKFIKDAYLPTYSTANRISRGRSRYKVYHPDLYGLPY